MIDKILAHYNYRRKPKLFNSQEPPKDLPMIVQACIYIISCLSILFFIAYVPVVLYLIVGGAR